MLEGGTWFIANQPLFLQKWQPGLVLEKLSFHKFPIWVVLCGTPLELLTPHDLSCIASAIGMPLSLDKVTEQRRVPFYRVCMEVACGNDLPEKIMVDIETLGQMDIFFEYAWKYVMCSICKSLGIWIMLAD